MRTFVITSAGMGETHDVERGLAEADRVLGLRDGRALLEGPAQTVSAAQVLAVYGASSGGPA